MSLSVKEILNIGRRQLEESHIADAAIDCKILYCFDECEQRPTDSGISKNPAGQPL